MGVSLKIDRPFFLLVEGILNGFLLLVLPMLPIPSYIDAFLGLVVNLVVAYLIAETPNQPVSTPVSVTQAFSRVWNRLRYWARPFSR